MSNSSPPEKIGYFWTYLANKYYYLNCLNNTYISTDSFENILKSFPRTNPEQYLIFKIDITNPQRQKLLDVFSLTKEQLEKYLVLL